MSEDRASVMTLLRAFGKAFNAGDVDGILACVTDDHSRTATDLWEGWRRVVLWTEDGPT